MGTPIIITAEKVTVHAELNETKTAKAIEETLPIKAKANLWGDEIYFQIPVNVEQETPLEVVEMGDIAYWPPGNAMCFFFGRTPASVADEIRPASEVTVVGKIIGDAKVLKSVPARANILIEKAN